MTSIGQTLSADQFQKQYQVGHTLTADQFQQHYGAPVAPVAHQSSIPGTFASNPIGNPLIEGLKTAANVPASAVNFAVKGVGGTLNPLNTFKTAQNLGTSIAGAQQEGVKLGDVVKELPGAAYHTLVPSFIQHLIAGRPAEAARAITEDPVGQIAPIILMARGAAEKAGVGPQFDQVMAQTTKIATKPITAPGGAVLRGAGKVASETLGVTTGAGGEAIRQAFNPTPEFTSALRGHTTEASIVDKAQGMFDTIKENQRTAYRAKLETIKEAQTPVDFKPVQNAMHTQLKNFGVGMAEDGTLDFSRSQIGNDPQAMHVIESAFKDITDWGKQPGDTTGAGLDILKKRLDDLYAPTSQSRAFIQGVKTVVSDTLKQNVPGYEEMTKGYGQTAQLLDEIKSGTGAGGKAGADTVIKKLTSSLKQNQDFRLEMVKQLEQHSGENVLQELSGSSLNSALPRGIVGKGLDIYGLTTLLRGVMDPTAFAEIATSSPRLVGEFVRALGLSTAKTARLLNQLNHFKIPTAAAIPRHPTPQDTQQP